MKNIDDPRDLGVGLMGREVILFYASKGHEENVFQIAKSTDGLHFTPCQQQGEIDGIGPKKENIFHCADFHTSGFGDNYLLTYKLRAQKHTYPHLAFSTDLLNWKRLGKFSKVKGTAIIVPDYKFNGKSVVYFGDKNINIGFSKDLKNWEIIKQPVLAPRKDHFDSYPLEVIDVNSFGEFLLVTYSSKKPVTGNCHYIIGAAIFDKRSPQILLWRSDELIWTQPEKWHNEKIFPLGAALLNENLLLYWNLEGKGVFVVSCLTPGQALTLKKKLSGLLLKRFNKNPIIKPIPEHHWESKATFNTAAIYEDGKVHFIYRAIGDKDLSVFGYASSSDGLNIDERLKTPVYFPKEPFECPDQKPVHLSSTFISGGGYGGCEDPRITKIDDKLYMTYVAFDGCNPPRVALTSIKVDDFLDKKWNWEKPILISPPGVIDKNACILPEKINDKYVLFHRIFPDILIDFVDDLSFHNYLKGQFRIRPRKDYWDSLKIGVGAPPMKTDDGWLLIYHSVGYQDRGRYKIGSMLLDLDNPAKVLQRSNEPILEPTENYENEGHKAGVAYPCGAAIVRDQLFVYYGGADTVVCAAHEDLKKFLWQLKSSHLPKLEPVAYPLKLSSFN